MVKARVGFGGKMTSTRGDVGENQHKNGALCWWMQRGQKIAQAFVTLRGGPLGHVCAGSVQSVSKGASDARISVLSAPHLGGALR